MHLRRVPAEQTAQRPCAHILAASVVAATSGGANVSKERFKDQTWVFTGALSLFTREAAEALITQGGGTRRAASAKTPIFWWRVNAPDRSSPKRSSWAFPFDRAGI
jgi:NAD-dependent DNA ligase